MATIRPIIYVGLGGTGIRAIAQTKKYYEDAYGKDNIPQQYAFAAIDFDLTAVDDPALATDISSDFLDLTVPGNPQTLYKVGSADGKYRWMFPGNAAHLKKSVTTGAGQVRTVGRFYTEMVVSKIDAHIQKCWNRVSSITVSDKDTLAENVEIHIVMSLAGGTGSGSFLNVAEIIRSKYGKKAQIIGYGVLHSIFRTMNPTGSKTQRVVANAYSAILDLDYLMRANTNNKIEIEINNHTAILDNPIYDAFFVVDSKTSSNRSLQNIDQLCEVVGNCLFASGSAIGDKVNSVLNNFSWQDHTYDISPKQAWVQTLGGCQVVYRGDLLAKIYGYKAALELIRKMTQEGADAHQLAQAWTMEAKVREDGETYNMLIDSIIAPEKIAGAKLPVVDINDSMTEANARLQTYISKLAELPEVEELERLSKEKEDKLNEEIDFMLRQENGVGNTVVFLRSLKKLCEKYRGEMTAESAEFKKRFKEKNDVMDKRFAEYADHSSRWLFKTKGGRTERLDAVARVAKELLQINYEIKRREVAKDIFINLLSVIDKASSRITSMVELLGDLRDEYENALNAAQNNSLSKKVFTYDLSAVERLQMKLNDGEVGIAAFMNQLGKSLWSIDIKKELRPAIETYVDTLPRTNYYRTVPIVDLIDNLPEAEYNDLKAAIITKSDRLLDIDDRGQTSKTHTALFPSAMMLQNFLVSMSKSKDKLSRFEKDNTFMKSAEVEWISSTLDSMKQRIIILRADYAIIPYCIEVFNDMVVESEYESYLSTTLESGSTSFNPHFDKNIFDDMRRTDFKLKPEVQNEALFYWVCGHIFGWRDVKETAYIMDKDSEGHTIKIQSKEEIEHPKYIRFMGKAYYFWQDSSTSRGRNDQWYPIGGINASHRQRAFENFKSIDFPRFKSELNAKVKSDITARGIDYYISIVKNIIKDGKYDYIDRLACTDKNSATYYAQNSSDIAQFDEEWNYIKFDKNEESQFINALKNLASSN